MILNKFKPFSISIRIVIVTVTLLMVVATCSALSLGIFSFTKDLLHRNLEKHIASILSTGVNLIDPEMHSKLKDPSQQSSSEYLSIQKSLKNIRNSDIDIRYVYTLRQFKGTQYAFVVDAEESEKNRSSLGSLQDYKSEILKNAFSTKKNVLVENKLEKDQWGVWFSGYAPIRRADGRIDAILGLDISAKTIATYDQQYFRKIFMITIAIMVIMVFLGIYLSKKISDPLYNFAEEINRISTLDFNKSYKMNSNIKEIVKINESIEKMKNGLKSFRKYVPSDLVAKLMTLSMEAKLGGEKKELTIFFSDIADFTNIAESLGPEELSLRLSKYLEVITTEITKLGGTVDKYIGDAVMAFWGAPNEIKYHAQLAALAAIRCQKKLALLNQQWQMEGKAPFLTRIGISTGEVIVGNFGYAKRLNYTVMGDAVNLANRLEGLNKFYDTAIMISPRTAYLCSEKFIMRKLDSVAVKGKNEVIFVHELLEEENEQNLITYDFVEQFSNALELYFSRKWLESKIILKSILEERSNDGPSKVILKRCEEFLLNPPGDDWSGIIFLREK